MMRKASFLYILISLFIIGVFLLPQADAQQSLNPATGSAEVSASVGDYYLSITGFIAPHASIILTSDGVFIRATVADATGYFSLSNVLIKSGFSGFCLQAVDFRRIGESEACFSFPPAKGDVVMNDIFLPPTLGMLRTEIEAGGTAVAFGYTMPGAKVTLHLSDGRKFTVTADSTGYYEVQIENVSAGVYTLFADANYEGKQSVAPTKKVQFRALSLWDQFLALLTNLREKLVRFITTTGFGPLWIGLPILILIIILILKLWPEKFTVIYESKLVKFFTHWNQKRDKKLHHAWFVGY